MFNKHSLVTTLTLSLALVLDSACASPTPSVHAEANPVGTGIAIPMRKRGGLAGPDGKFDEDKAKVHVVNTKNKHRQNLLNLKNNQGSLFTGEIPSLATLPEDLISRLSARNSKRQSEALTNEGNDELWDGQISIGSNSQKFIVDFDTGSADLWVPSSSNCTNDACASKSKFDPSASSSAEEQPGSFQIHYGDGSTVNGSIYADTVEVAGISVTSQHFAAVGDLSSSFGTSPFDGILGMAYGTISNLNSSPFFESAVNQGAVSSKEFGFYLAQNGSELYLGGTNNQHYTGDIEYHAVDTASSGYWKIGGGSVKVGSNAVISNINTVIDSGTTIVYGPTQAVKTFYDSVQGAEAYNGGGGFYTYPCDSPPDVSFNWGGKDWKISADNFNAGLAGDSNKCVGAIAGQELGLGDDTWLIGDSFMKNVYSAFDFGSNQVGFAQLST